MKITTVCSFLRNAAVGESNVNIEEIFSTALRRRVGGKEGKEAWHLAIAELQGLWLRTVFLYVVTGAVSYQAFHCL